MLPLTKHLPFVPRTSGPTYSFAILFSAFLAFFFMTRSGVMTAQCTQAESAIALFASMPITSSDVPTLDPVNSVGLQLDDVAFADLRLYKYNECSVTVPFIGGKSLVLDLELFLPFSDDFRIGRTQKEGRFIEETYLPQLLSYRIVTPGMKGTLVLMKNRVMGTLQWQGHQYEISALRQGKGGQHVVFLLSDAKAAMEFECAVNEEGPKPPVMPMGLQTTNLSNSVTSCVEVAIDIDFYTYGTFGEDCFPAVEWALALLAGVNTIYTNDLNNLINIQASYIHIWETTDPYASIINEAGSMLNTFRMEWLNNANLSGIQRDIVHLMTRRDNTGTGGIAYLDVVCFPQYAAGLSSYLGSETTYNLSNYSWNLNVVGHELGHNFGSNHTHWCGWPGGPIDNCYDVEGTCTNNPQAQVGTMMSYCHAVSGGSVNLNFHPTVISSAFEPTINSYGSCFNTCVDLTTTCGYYGCTDVTACNFDPEAVDDDGSCAYTIDNCEVCGGDDSSCSGCMDEAACNYDAEATLSDGSCFYPAPGSTCDCQEVVSFDVQLVAGETASETVVGWGYVTGFSVTLDFTDTPADQSWANEMMVGLTAPDGSCLQYGGYNLSLECTSAGSWPSGWNTSTAGTYTATATFANPLSGSGEWTITLLNSWNASIGANYVTTLTFDGLCATPEGIPGCTDSTACNYDANATEDDGSCLAFDECEVCGGTGIEAGTCDCDGNTPEEGYDCDGNCLEDTDGDGVCDADEIAGCTDSTACNYNATATDDDDSCEFVSCACPEDLNGDGEVSVSDILIFLSDFGCIQTDCVGDVNGDGDTNVGDLLLLLAQFGESC